MKWTISPGIGNDITVLPDSILYEFCFVVLIFLSCCSTVIVHHARQYFDYLQLAVPERRLYFNQSNSYSFSSPFCFLFYSFCCVFEWQNTMKSTKQHTVNSSLSSQWDSNNINKGNRKIDKSARFWSKQDLPSIFVSARVPSAICVCTCVYCYANALVYTRVCVHMCGSVRRTGAYVCILFFSPFDSIFILGYSFVIVGGWRTVTLGYRRLELVCVRQSAYVLWFGLRMPELPTR